MKPPDNPFVISLTPKEQQLFREIASSQVRKIPLEEYAQGSERYERLWASMQDNQRFTFGEMETI